MEVCNIVQKAMTKTIPKKKILARRERQRRKGKIYISECRITKNSKERLESFLKVNSAKKKRKSIEWEKTRDLFKNIRDTKGTFHAKMGMIEDRNDMDLTKAEDVKKRWQEHTEELYKKGLSNPDDHSGVVTQLEPDILECEVKWALRSITTNKASGGDGIPVELFQIQKMIL